MLTAIPQTFVVNRQTQAAGTAIVDITQPVHFGKRAKLSSLRWENGATANQVNVQSAFTKVSLNDAASRLATQLRLAFDPGVYSRLYPPTRPAMVADNPIAANDYIAYKTSGGLWVLALVSAVSVDPTSGVATVTVPAIQVALVKGTKVVYYGAVGDLSPNTGRGPSVFAPAASAVTTLGDTASGSTPIAQSDLNDAPLLIHSTNLTNASILHYATGYSG